MVDIKEVGKEDDDSGVDYAATADAFFGGKGGAQSDSEEDSSNDEDADDDDDDKDDKKDKDTDAADAEEDGEDSSSEEDDEETAPSSAEIAPPVSKNNEPCTFDLRNLLAMNSHQINAKALYKRQSNKGKKGEQNEDEDKATIPLPEAQDAVDESYLLEKALDGCAQLVAALWQLPKEKSDAGAMVRLPLQDESRVPRALPPPEPKKETKWEKFAKERGIPLNKNKRSQKVWDEATGAWMYRHGYNKANDDGKEWPIMEVKDNEDPFEDPWERKREAKRARVEKNTEQRMRNQERGGALAKGTTTKLLKSKDRARQRGKAGGNKDRDSVSSVKVPPSGVPVDLKPTKASGPVAPSKRGMNSTLSALAATQRSTASMGRFDKMREDEPERKKALSSMKKRKYESATDKKTAQTERERSMKVLKNVVEGGGAAKERDIRKGRYAKGETAYDYEFDDGLGASSYKKKKGRSGVGKAKKLTKKRIK